MKNIKESKLCIEASYSAGKQSKTDILHFYGYFYVRG